MGSTVITRSEVLRECQHFPGEQTLTGKVLRDLLVVEMVGRAIPGIERLLDHHTGVKLWTNGLGVSHFPEYDGLLREDYFNG